MNTDPQLHHVGKRIAPQSLEVVLEVFRLLGCEITYQPDNKRWAMVGQVGLSFDIQLVEVDEAPIKSSTRTNSHIAFLSATPQEQVAKVEKWASENGVIFERGAWNDNELWFDLPDLFVDFVVEVMNVSVVQA